MQLLKEEIEKLESTKANVMEEVAKKQKIQKDLEKEIELLKTKKVTMPAKAEVEIRNRMAMGAELLKKYVPGFEKAFIARTSPSMVIRRGRQIICDYDITHC